MGGHSSQERPALPKSGANSTWPVAPCGDGPGSSQHGSQPEHHPAGRCSSARWTRTNRAGTIRALEMRDRIAWSPAKLPSPTLLLALACSPTPAAEAPSGRPTAAAAGVATTPTSAPKPDPSASATTPEPEVLAPDHVRSQADCPEGMVFIPGGHFTYRGPRWDVYDNRNADVVTREFDIKPFCIDLREVQSFTLESSCPACRQAPHNTCASTSGSLPATCITQQQAALFCETSLPEVGKRLPSAEEWLYAAIGTDGRRFPWGNTWFPWGNDRREGRPDHRETGKVFCDIRERHITETLLDTVQCSAASTSLDVSPLGVQNMGSNVLELTSATYVRSEYPHRNRRCPGFGLNHAYFDWNGGPELGPPVAKGLIDSAGISCDERDSLELRTNATVGFRCAASTKAAR